MEMEPAGQNLPPEQVTRKIQNQKRSSSKVFEGNRRHHGCENKRKSQNGNERAHGEISLKHFPVNEWRMVPFRKLPGCGI